jgi:hypothetical protein
MDSFICEFCNKNFVSKTNLTTHQKRAKFCLKQRGEISEEFKCKYCYKNFASQFTLENHLDTCKKRNIQFYENKIQEIEKQYKSKEEIYIFQIEELKAQNKELQDKLLNFASDIASEAVNKETIVNHYKTTNQTTNIDKRTINMIPFDLTEEQAYEKLKLKFTEKHLMRGQKGLAECVIKELLQTHDGKMLMKCTDPSRKLFITINQDGKLEKDINASNLTNIIHQPAKKVCKEILDDMEERYHEIRMNTEDLEEEDEERKYLQLETERLNYATTKAIEISSLNKNNSDFVNGILPVLSK